MRVIAGSAGGLPLVVPKKGVRPTMDRVKAAIFSSLGDAIVDAKVLPCGTRALRQAGADVRFDVRDIAGVDGAVGVHVGAEICSIKRLSDSRFGLRDIAGIHRAVGIGVADEHTHLHTNVAHGRAIIYTEQRYRNPLRISYT